MSQPGIRRMSQDDMEVVCDVIGLAFAHNPSTLATVRGDEPKACRVMRDGVRVAKFGRTCSFALVAEEEGQIIGALNAAEWPHCQPRLWEKVMAVPTLARTLGADLPRAFRTMKAWAIHDPHEPHWHIGPIGVHPEHQGRGVGQALIHSFLQTVDGQRRPAFLETDVDRNVSLYEKFGFEVTSRQLVIGVDTRFMWRHPVPA
jgi:ribosomal protein S18 acetylase RimI-like enzyme